MTQRAVIYGSSLYDLATEENLAEVIWEEMNAVRQIMRENPDYMSLLSNASLSKQERTALLQEAFAVLHTCIDGVDNTTELVGVYTSQEDADKALEAYRSEVQCEDCFVEHVVTVERFTIE